MSVENKQARQAQRQEVVYQLICALDHLDVAEEIIYEWREKASSYGLRLRREYEDVLSEVREALGYISDALNDLKAAGLDVERPPVHFQSNPPSLD